MGQVLHLIGIQSAAVRCEAKVKFELNLLQSDTKDRRFIDRNGAREL